MRILILHNRYRHPGGEDAVVKAEAKLLRDSGQEVHVFECSNEEIAKYSFFKKIVFMLQLGWSRSSYNEVRKIIKKFKPDVVHCHNIFFILTPSVYQACIDESVAVVQSLHNFRPLCINALLLREGKICEKCSEKKNFFNGIIYRCYKNSFLMSFYMAIIFTIYNLKRVWQNKISCFIASTEFGRRKYAQYGFDESKICVKPNINIATNIEVGVDEGYALYVGRLSQEKGVQVLLDAWSDINLPLKIVGSGPLLGESKKYIKDKNICNVEFLGFVESEDYDKYMKGAKFLVVPSVCYENFPRVIAEAFTYGIPVVASDLGSMPEIIEEQVGLLFERGNSESLNEKIKHLLANEDKTAKMRENIRKQ
ncbi:MAG: glycosyltransferase, partial [Candidatus Zapsychrus exili]|nr:glycosyltransferase [Candidatus Zapsychrus exili]